MADTTKVLSEYDQQQILQKVYNKEEGTLAVGSFVVDETKLIVPFVPARIATESR